MDSSQFYMYYTGGKCNYDPSKVALYKDCAYSIRYLSKNRLISFSDKKKDNRKIIANKPILSGPSL